MLGDSRTLICWWGNFWIHQSCSRLLGVVVLTTRVCHFFHGYLVNTGTSSSLAGREGHQPLNPLVGKQQLFPRVGGTCCHSTSDGYELVHTQTSTTRLWHGCKCFPGPVSSQPSKVIMSHLKTFTSASCACITVLEIRYSEHHTWHKIITFCQKLDADVADLCASQHEK